MCQSFFDDKELNLAKVEELRNLFYVPGEPDISRLYFEHLVLTRLGYNRESAYDELIKAHSLTTSAQELKRALAGGLIGQKCQCLLEWKYNMIFSGGQS
jgi:hypothetical protein